MKYAVAYARYSSTNQTEQSIEGQLHDIYDFAKSHDYEIKMDYCDRALSGTSDNRPALQNLIADSRKHKFDTVLVWKLDRFSRNLYEAVNLRKKLKDNGVRIISVTEYFGDGSTAELMENSMLAYADYFSKDLSEKVKRGMHESALKGKWMGGYPMFGYKIVDGKQVIDDTQAHYVVDMYNKYLSGMTCMQIANYMTSMGLKKNDGLRFNNQTILKMLRNEKYIGIYRYHGELLYEDNEAIIDKETFAMVQNKIKQNAIYGGRHKARIPYPLSGKIFCGKCGASLRASGSTILKNGGLLSYYKCTNRIKFASCDLPSIRKDKVENDVIDAVMDFISISDNADKIAQAMIDYSAKIDPDIEKRIKFNHDSMLELKKQQHDLTDAFISTKSVAMRESLDKQMDALESKVRSLQNDIDQDEIVSKKFLDKNNIVKYITHYKDLDRNDESVRKNIFDCFVHKVIVFSQDKIIVEFNISNEQKQEVSDNSGNDSGNTEDKSFVFPILRNTLVFGKPNYYAYILHGILCCEIDKNKSTPS